MEKANFFVAKKKDNNKTTVWTHKHFIPCYPNFA